MKSLDAEKNLKPPLRTLIRTNLVTTALCSKLCKTNGKTSCTYGVGVLSDGDGSAGLRIPGVRPPTGGGGSNGRGLFLERAAVAGARR